MQNHYGFKLGSGHEETTPTPDEHVIVEEVNDSEADKDIIQIKTGHNHNTRKSSRTYAHLNKEHIFNIQGKKIPNKQIYNNETHDPVLPHQDAIIDIHNHMMATEECFTQLSTKAAVQEFGQDAVAAILKEVTQ